MSDIQVSVTCPHCHGVSINPPLTLHTIGDEEVYSVTCPECSEPFRVGGALNAYPFDSKA